MAEEDSLVFTQSAVRPEADRWARISMWCGALFFLTPIPPVLAIIYGLLALGRMSVTGKPGRALALGGVAAGLLGVAFWWQVAAMVGRISQTEHAVGCMANLREIGGLILRYSHSHGGQFPASFADVVDEEGFDPRWFVCPASNATVAIDGSAGSVGGQLLAGGHNSYIYLGRGLTEKSPDMEPVAYCAFSPHPFVNILYADGHGDAVSREDAVRVIQQAADRAGRPTTQAATRTSP